MLGSRIDSKVTVPFGTHLVVAFECIYQRAHCVVNRCTSARVRLSNIIQERARIVFRRVERDARFATRDISRIHFEATRTKALPSSVGLTLSIGVRASPWAPSGV